MPVINQTVRAFMEEKKPSVNRTLQLIVQFNSLPSVQIQAVDGLSQII